MISVVLVYRTPGAWPGPIEVGTPARCAHIAHKTKQREPDLRVTILGGATETEVTL